MAKLLLKLKQPIRSFCIKNDILAVAQDNILLIYKYSTLSLIQTIKNHDKTITSIDINETTGNILTTSEDRTCLVLTPSNNTYTIAQVATRFLKSINFGKWNKSGTKFIITSSDMAQLGVCYYDSSINWWISKHISIPDTQLHGNSLKKCSWDPENDILITFADNLGNLLTVSTFLKHLDNKDALKTSIYDQKFPFGKVLTSWYPNNNLIPINDVAYVPNTKSQLLVLIQIDGSITLFDNLNGNTIARIYNKDFNKPFNVVKFITDTEFIIAGYNNFALLYSLENNQQIKFIKSLNDIPQQNAVNKTEDDEEQFTSGIQALKMFKNMDSRGVNQTVNADFTNSHVMTITDLTVDSGNVITSGLDGKLISYSL